MTTIEINSVAKKIFNEVKSVITENKEHDKELVRNVAYVDVYRTNSPYLDRSKPWDGVSICVKGDFMNSKSHKVENKAKKDWHLTLADRKAISKVLIELLETQKTKRGWKNLSWEIYDNEFQDRYALGLIKNVILTAEPCKEWETLQKYIAKYCGRFVGDKDIWSVGIGGKRGRIYGEEGDRNYISHYPKRCNKYLEELKKARGINDRVSTNFKKVDDIDPWDLQCSIRNEVEFSGSRIYYLEVKFITPNGKEKIVNVGK